MSGLTRYEQETIINYNEAEAIAGVYTHNKSLRRRLERLAGERPEECRLEKVSRHGDAADYIIPKSWIHIYPPRQISEEQRAAMAERLKTAKLREKAPTGQGDFAHEAAGEGNYTSDGTDAEKEA